MKNRRLKSGNTFSAKWNWLNYSEAWVLIFVLNISLHYILILWWFGLGVRFFLEITCQKTHVLIPTGTSCHLRLHVNATGQVSCTYKLQLRYKLLWGMSISMWECFQIMEQSSHTPMRNCSILKHFSSGQTISDGLDTKVKYSTITI